MKRLIIAAATAAALMVSGCETATPYQPLVKGSATSGGYSDVQVEPDHSRVSFAGNSLTSRDTVETYLLYRAAELSLAQGFDWFETADRHTDRKSDTYVDAPFGHYGRWGPYWGPSWSYYRGGRWGGWGPWGPDPFFDVHQITRYQASAEIVMGHGAKPADDPRAFDAHAVSQDLGPKIVRPTA